MRRCNARRVPSRARRAFTLLEIIVVVTIIALLATLVAPKLLKNIGSSKIKIAQTKAGTIAQQVNLYCLDNSMSKPPRDFDLSMLLQGDDPYFDTTDAITDPWENPFVVKVPGDIHSDFDVISFGADGKPGGDGEDADIIHK